MKIKFERQYYEDERLWDQYTMNPWLAEKIRTIQKIIPSDVQTIADIGCGNGLISKSLVGKYSLVGFDRSLNALKNLKFPKIVGDASKLPFQDKSFDLVISSEVLEHIPGDNLKLSVLELERISKKYILITVPNHENLQKNAVKCHKCQYIFNSSYHYNSFNKNNLQNIHTNFKAIKVFECGKLVRQYAKALLKIRQKWGNSWGRFKDERPVVCPNCGSKFLIQPHQNFISFVCDGLNCLFSRRKPFWLGMLLQRNVL